LPRAQASRGRASAASFFLAGLSARATASLFEQE